MRIDDLFEQCARLYRVGAHKPYYGPYGSFVYETRIQFNKLPVMVEWTQTDPYESAEELFSACDRGSFEVFSGGSFFACDHPLAVGERNLTFKSVHDWFGHYGGHDKPHYDFSIEGELKAWLRHEAQYSAESLPALFCETVLQLAVHAVTSDFVKLQRCVIAPDSLIEEVREYAATITI